MKRTCLIWLLFVSIALAGCGGKKRGPTYAEALAEYTAEQGEMERLRARKHELEEIRDNAVNEIRAGEKRSYEALSWYLSLADRRPSLTALANRAKLAEWFSKRSMKGLIRSEEELKAAEAELAAVVKSLDKPDDCDNDTLAGPTRLALVASFSIWKVMDTSQKHLDAIDQKIAAQQKRVMRAAAEKDEAERDR